MSIYKKTFGYFLILFALSTTLLIGFPQVFSSTSTGRIDKDTVSNVAFLKKEQADIVLLYFGYVGCSNVCLPALSQLNDIYSKISNKKNVSIYFINLLSNMDKGSAKFFATQFNSDFKGIQLKESILKKVTSEFNVTYSKSLINDYAVNHAGHLYFLVKDKAINKYKQKYIYTTKPYIIENIIKDIENILQQNKKD